MNRTWRTGAAAVALLLLGTGTWVLLAIGPTGGDVEDWRLTTSDGTLLCSRSSPCDDAGRAELRAEGVECLWTGRVALDGQHNPAVVRDLKTTLYAVAWRGFQTNGSTHAWTLPLDLGSWWRAAGKETTVTLPLPCDVEQVTLAFNLSGTATTGRPFQVSRAVRLAF